MTLHRHSISLPALTTFFAALLILAPAPSAAKQIIDSFGDPGAAGGQFGSVPRGVATNEGGAGPASPGDIYVVDSDNHRIQRIGRDDNGTPAVSDDTYFFVSAWGADVDATPTGGSDYEICAVASECKAGVASGGNGTAAGNGALSSPRGIAVDQETGNVYVTDAGNHRVSVYDGAGAFLRSFGYGVVASGPGDVPAPSEQQKLTVKASGGKFSLVFEDEVTGARGGGQVVGSSKTISGVTTASGSFDVGQVLSGEGAAGAELFPPLTMITAVKGDSLTVSQPALSENLIAGLFGEDIPYNASAAEVQAALNALPTIGGVGGSVTVSGGPGDSTGVSPYVIDFGGSLAGEDTPLIEAGSRGLTIAAGTPSAQSVESTQGGSYEICVATDGDICKAGRFGAGIGEIGRDHFDRSAGGIAVSQPNGDPEEGSVFLADAINNRVSTYDLDGENPSSIGSATFPEATSSRVAPEAVAVDSRGILYASSVELNGPGFSDDTFPIERYDTADANGGGVGFLAPIKAGVDERQKVTIGATGGSFRLEFKGETTSELPFNVTEAQMKQALGALASIGGANVNVIGGPGNASGSSPYTVTFGNGLGSADVPQLLILDGFTPLSGGSGASVTTSVPGQAGTLRANTRNLAVDPDSDGPGSDSDILYATSISGAIQQFGPLNPPGSTTPPSDDNDRHNTNGAVSGGLSALAVEPSTGRFYATEGRRVYVLDNVSSTPPTASLDSFSDTTTNSTVIHATINPNGPPATRYHFEYSTDGVDWLSTPEVFLGTQETPQVVSETLKPGAVGLEPNTLYHVRLVAGRKFAEPVVTPALTFTTLAASPVVETTGTPLRTTTTAQLLGRVAPNKSATTYHFEYGAQGPCDANPCIATADASAGSSNESKLVAEAIQGLEPDTTYHYRLVAESAAPGPPVLGENMTVTTRASEGPLSHGHFPGPPGSDRAYELVSLPDSSGNPVGLALAFSDQGTRAAYGIFGGTPIATSGSLLSLYYAERASTGWQTKLITPPRDELAGPFWKGFFGPGDLSNAVAINYSEQGEKKQALWKLDPENGPGKLFQSTPGVQSLLEVSAGSENFVGVSADGSRAVAQLAGGALDPAYPAAAAEPNLYALGGAAPRLISLLPGDALAPCGTEPPSGMHPGAFGQSGLQAAHWVSADGSLVYFASTGEACQGASKLYVRDIGAAVTKLVSPLPLSGPSCGAGFVKAISGAAFFSTSSRLDVVDSVPSNCSDSNDVYRYDLESGSAECVTCVVPGGDAEVTGTGPDQISISDDGSRLYFTTKIRLLPGASPSGRNAIYRVDLTTGGLAHVAPLTAGHAIGYTQGSNALTPDGSQLIFRSPFEGLSALGGSDNGGTAQYYRYDDRDRSLVCVSCPLDGAVPRDGLGEMVGQGDPGHPNVRALSDNGIFAFSTSTPLVAADQNTPSGNADPASGADIYEWRDGRYFLVTDGLTNWNLTPEVEGITPSGQAIFFGASAQYTPDAIDAGRRLYTARIGGGIDFPAAPTPCPLEVCQGTPRGAPEEQAPGTGAFVGPGNTVKTRPARCRKGKVRRRGRCVSKRRKKAHRRNQSKAHRRNQSKQAKGRRIPR